MYVYIYEYVASHFNYAYDSQITSRPIEVSGVNIPNNQSRIIPNRGTQLCYQKTIMPINKEICNLSQNSIGVCGADDSTLENQNLQFKASKQRLTRQELMGLAAISAIT